MGIGLAHIDFTPLFYGCVMFLGLWSMYHKATHGQYVAFIIEVGVFALVFKLHGGTMAGGFAAMVCALLAGSIFPTLRRTK
jgi:hypothetical protein